MLIHYKTDNKTYSALTTIQRIELINYANPKIQSLEAKAVVLQNTSKKAKSTTIPFDSKSCQNQ